MQSTASSIARAAGANKPVVPPLRGLGSPSGKGHGFSCEDQENAYASAVHPSAVSGVKDATRERMVAAVQLRAELRKQRIRDRVAEECTQKSTAQVAYQDPSEQWHSYLAKCALGGKDANRRSASVESIRRAHKTSDRVFASDEAPSARGSAPIVDSHGMWVGEEVESKLRGAAGASSADLWKSKHELAPELKRREFALKAAARADAAASAAARAADRIAKAPDVVDRLKASADALVADYTLEGREPTPSTGSVGALVSGASDGAYGLENRIAAEGAPGDAAGMSSKELYRGQRETHGILAEDGSGRLPTPPVGRKPLLVDVDAKVAGLTSSDLYSRQFALQPRTQVASPSATKARGNVAGKLSTEHAHAEHRIEAITGPSAKEASKPDLRIGSEAMDVITGKSSEAAANVSNAPTQMFDGAAGMNSAQVRRASGAKERRHSSPLLGVGERSKLNDSPRIRRAAAVDIPAASQTSDPFGAVAGGGADAPTTAQHQPSPARPSVSSTAIASAAAASSAAPGYAGARSSTLQRPTSAWEARHLWSEQPRVPKGGFGGKVPLVGGAGLSSDKLATSSAEYKLEQQPRRPEPMSGRAAASTLPEPKGEPSDPKPSKRREASESGLSVAQLQNVAGASSRALADAARPASIEVPKPLTEVASLSGQQTRVEVAERPALDLSSLSSFAGAAGVSSKQSGIDAAKKECVMADRPRDVRGSATPTGRNDSSSGVGRTVFSGFDEGAPPTAASPQRAGPIINGRHGMASRDIAYGRLLSRGEHDHHTGGGRRSASEPRRRPGAESGNEAKALIFGNRHDEGNGSSAAQSRFERSAIGSPQLARRGASGAGVSSRDLNAQPEERAFRRGQRDSFSGTSLGDFMDGSVDHRRTLAVRGADSPVGMRQPNGLMRIASPRPTAAVERHTSPHRNASTLVLG